MVEGADYNVQTILTPAQSGWEIIPIIGHMRETLFSSLSVHKHMVTRVNYGYYWVRMNNEQI